MTPLGIVTFLIWIPICFAVISGTIEHKLRCRIKKLNGYLRNQELKGYIRGFRDGREEANECYCGECGYCEHFGRTKGMPENINFDPRNKKSMENKT